MPPTSRLKRIFLLVLLFTACTATPVPTTQPVSIVVSGSQAMMPLLSALIDAFQAQHVSVTMILEPGNAYQGVQQVLDRTADLGALSVVPPDEVWSAPIALNAIGIIVHPDNPLQNMTLAQVHDVFDGRVWHWQDLGLALADEIAVVSREEGSGTRMLFEALVMAYAADRICEPTLSIDPDANADNAVRTSGCGGGITPTAVVMPGSGAVLEYVAASRGAIGYVSQSHISEGVKAVRVEELLPAAENIRDGGYHLVQPFFLIAAQEPTGAARQFLDFCLSPVGQEIVAEQHVPVRKAP